MAISQLPQAPYRQDRRVYPTPIIGDVLFSEVRDCTRSEIPEYGTPHPNPKKWPDHKLVFVKPVDIERDGIFEFFYAAERDNQDLYNFSSGYRNVIGNAGGREFRVVQRSYVTLRDKFQPMDIEFATPMMNVPEGKFDDVEYVFFDRQQQQIQEQELNALFVAEVHTYIEKAFLEYKLSYGTQKSEVVPEKFRALIPQTTTEQIVNGLAEQPVLSGTQLSVSEDQINPDIKVVRTVSRADQQTGYSLSGKQVTNDLQIADVEETIVPDGTTIVASELTVDGSVESLGNGQSIQRVITVPELFKAESYSAERPDLIPPQFRAIAPTTTEELNVVGAATKPVLSVGELAATEQQQNKFVKRTRKTKRDITALPQSLTQKATTNDRQIATVTETLQVGDTSAQPSATVEIESQALGDGTYVVRKTEVPEIFSGKSFSKRQFTTLPEKFKSNAVTSAINLIGQASEPSLGPDEISRTEEQINQFVYRKESTTIPDLSTGAKTLVGKQAYVVGAIATVTESIESDPNIDTGYLIEESSSTPLGDGKFLKQTVQVDEWPTLISAEWDDNINAQSIQRQTVVDNNQISYQIPNTSSRTSFKAVNKDRTIVTEDFAPQEINSYLSSTKTRINLNVPPVLQQINVDYAGGGSDATYSEEGVDNAESIAEGSVSITASGSAGASISLQPVLDIQMEQVWANDLIATNYFYFVTDPDSYLTELNSRLSSNISEWPVFKTKIYTLSTAGGSADLTKKFNKSISKSLSEDREAIGKSIGEGETSGGSRNIDIVKIGPCLCSGITISEPERTSWRTIFTPNLETTFGVTASVYPSYLPPSGVTDIPRSGLYVVDSRIEPYRWGYYRVSATVINADQLA